jgi:hypothetical protein
MIDHVLLNGEVWATQATPTAIPPMWNTRGFIWAGLAVSGFALQCMKEEEITSMDACRKGGDGTIAYDGSVDKRDQLIEEHMLTSIRFIR